MEKIETRGGARPGSGRKAVHPCLKRVQTTISISSKTKERIKILHQYHNIRIGRVVDVVVDDLYKRYYNEEVGNI